MRRWSLVLLLLAVPALTWAPAGAAPGGGDGYARVAHPGAATVLEGFDDMVVDQVHGRVFISQALDELVVTDLDGHVETVIPRMWGAEDMVLSDDSSTLYVALFTGDAVAAVDTGTLEVERLRMPVGSCPATLAITADTVWVAGSCNRQHHQVRALDPVDGTVSEPLISSYSPTFVTSPRVPDTLWVSSAGAVHRFRATGGAAPSLVGVAYRDNSAADVITPDGSELVSASRQVLASEDLAGQGRYDRAPESQAVAVRSDGLIAFGGESGLVATFDSATRAPVGAQQLPDDERSTTPQGLAFGAVDLYVVWEDPTNDRALTLSVLHPGRTATLTLTAPREQYLEGEQVVVDVRLDGPTEGEVEVWAQVPGEEARVLERVQVGESGTAQVSLTPSRTTMITGFYAGDDVYASTSAVGPTAQVEPRLTARPRNHESYDGALYTFARRERVKVVARMDPSHAGECVTIRAEYRSGPDWRRLDSTGCVRVSDNGRVVGVLGRTNNAPSGPGLRAFAVYAGSESNLPTQSYPFEFRHRAR